MCGFVHTKTIGYSCSPPLDRVAHSEQGYKYKVKLFVDMRLEELRIHYEEDRKYYINLLKGVL